MELWTGTFAVRRWRKLQTTWPQEHPRWQRHVWLGGHWYFGHLASRRMGHRQASGNTLKLAILIKLHGNYMHGYECSMESNCRSPAQDWHEEFSRKYWYSKQRSNSARAQLRTTFKRTTNCIQIGTNLSRHRIRILLIEQKRGNCLGLATYFLCRIEIRIYK